MSYGMTRRVALPFATTVDRVREVLSEQGFGVLTEVDVKATMRAKLDAEVEDYLILGACNPPLALKALDADRCVGLLLPCNVVVRSSGEGDTIVEALDPRVISQLSDAPGLDEVSELAASKLRAALRALDEPAA